MRVISAKIFASHYQFYVYDVDFDHYKDPRLDWSSPHRLEFGYLATERAIYVSTVAGLNTHRIRVFVDEEPHQKEYERIFTSCIKVAGDAIQISAPENCGDDDINIPVQAGDYQVTICSKCLGIDELTVLPENDEPLPDDEFLLREDIESYDIYIKRLSNSRFDTEATRGPTQSLSIRGAR